MRVYTTYDKFIRALRANIGELCYMGDALTPAQQLEVAQALLDPNALHGSVAVYGSASQTTQFSSDALSLLIEAAITKPALRYLKIDNATEISQQVIDANISSKIDEGINAFGLVLQQLNYDITTFGDAQNNLVKRFADVATGIVPFFVVQRIESSKQISLRSMWNTLCDNLKKLTEVTEVVVTSPIPPDAFETLVALIKNSDRLECVCFDNQLLEDHEVGALLAELGGKGHFKDLSLAGNDLTELSAQTIAAFTGGDSKLRSLNLSRNPSLTGLVDLAKTLRELKTFAQLELRAVVIDAALLSELAQLQQHAVVIVDVELPKLEVLQRQQLLTHFETVIGNLVAAVDKRMTHRSAAVHDEAFGDLVVSYVKLNNLVSQANEKQAFTPNEFEALTNRLETAGKKLVTAFSNQVIDFTGCHLGKNDWLHLMTLLAQTPRQPNMSFTGSNISGKALAYLANIFNQQIFLTSLTLTAVTIPPLLASNLLLSLNHQKQLVKLEFTNTKIGDAHTDALCELLVNLPRLRFFDLRMNSFSTKSLIKLITAAEKSTSLLSFRVDVAEPSDIYFRNAINTVVIRNLFTAFENFRNRLATKPFDQLDQLQLDFEELTQAAALLKLSGGDLLSVNYCKTELKFFEHELERLILEWSQMPQPVESVAPTRAAAISADALSSALVQTIASLTPQQSAPITTTTATPSSAARPSFFTSSGSVSAEKKSASAAASTKSKRRATVLPRTTANLATLPVKNSMEQRATRSTGPTSPIAISNSAFLPAPQNSTPLVAQIDNAIGDVHATSSNMITAKDFVVSAPTAVRKSVAKNPVSHEKQQQIATTIAELFKLVSLHARHARLKASEPVRACLFKQSAEDSRSNAGQIANALVEMQKLLGKKRDYEVELMRNALAGIEFLVDFIREGRAAALADYPINNVDDLIDSLIIREIRARRMAEYEAIGDPQDTPAL